MVEELKDVIINARSVLSRRERRRDRILTTAMWVLYGYLWLPLISLLAWYLGVRFAYDLVIRAGGLESLLTILFWFGIVLMGTAIIIVGWSAVQRGRFARHERRIWSPSLDPEAERRYWDLPEDVFQCLRRDQRLLVRLDAEGQIESVAEATADGSGAANTER